MSESFLDRVLHLAPLWLLALLLFGGMAGAAWLGLWLRRRRERKPGAEESDKDGLQEGYVVSAVMGLLALLIGFTFSLAIDRFDTRREHVMREANAIRTAYLQAQLLEEPHRARISRLLAGYADTRIALADFDPASAPPAMAEKNRRAVDDLWAATVAAFPSIRGYDFSSSFIQSVNGLIETNAARQQARRAHVPSEIFLVLFLYQLIAAGVIGYALVGRGGRNTGAMLLLLFGISLILVIDIDRPTGGGITADQGPMLRLREALKGWPPGSFDRFLPAPGR